MALLQRYWRATTVLGVAFAFVLAVPSLPNRTNHVWYWAAAFILEVVLIWALSPLTQK